MHELRNVQLEQNHDEDEIMREQRERMPDIAFMREDDPNEVNQENEPPGLLSRRNQIYSQPDIIRRALNDNRETFAPNGSKFYHREENWNQPPGDTIYNLYKEMFDQVTEFTNVKIRKTLEMIRSKNEPITHIMAEVTNEDIKKYFGTLLLQVIFKGNHMTIRD